MDQQQSAAFFQQQIASPLPSTSILCLQFCNIRQTSQGAARD